MKPFISILCGAALMLAPAICNGQEAYFENTLNFVDITGATTATGNIIQTVAEGTLNEKEVEFGDFDNDGDMDVLIGVAQSDFGQRRNKLYLNDRGVFTEVSGTSVNPPIIAEFANTSTSRNAFLRDFDDDGWLDIIIVNDSNVGATSHTSPGRTKFFHNKHPNGVFSHFENETGRLDGASGAACSSVAFDLDGNGLCDFFMANYPFTSQDRIFLNGYDDGGGADPAGIFTEVTSSHLPTDSDYAVDVNAGDMNGDGLLDLLINSNGFDHNYIRYNNNLGAGEGNGDFNYSGNSFTRFDDNNGYEGAMDPADFDGDGKLDFLFVNKGVSGGPIGADVIMRNVGNSATNMANFDDSYSLPPDVSGDTKKATISDLDGDGRLDIILMATNRRPYIYRNASVPGTIKFVEWTPRPAFPAGNAHDGWHANAFNTDADLRPEIFLGAFVNDHLFRNEQSAVYDEASLGGVLPAFHNEAPIAVLGSSLRNEIDSYTASGISAGANVSVILRSYSNVALQVKDSNGTVIASSDIGLAHAMEAVQFDAPGGDITIEVDMVQLSGDGNEDGIINLRDRAMIRGSCFMSREPECLIFDFDANGIVNFRDAGLFRGQFSGGPASQKYVIEFNSRSD